MLDCSRCGKPVPDDAFTCPACGEAVTRPNDTMASPAPPTHSRAGVAPSAGAAAPAPRAISGRYVQVRRLGGGGMGTVFLAEQVGVGNKVALKYLAPQLSGDPGLTRRFLQEGKVSVEVHHPGAAQLLDMGQDESGQLFLAFEYVEGQDVRELLEREGRLPLEEARLIALRVAEVLAFAHERGIVHRDIKPENVRVRRDLAHTHVKVLDFGIAKLTQSAGAKLTREGGMAGTPRYMSPEQVESGTIDGRADVYALGLLLFEMLTGQPAYAADNLTQLFKQQLLEPMPKLAVVDLRFDAPELDAVLAKACAKAPADRFPDMKAFIAALKAAQAPGWPAVGTPARPSGPRAPLVTPMAREAAPPHAATAPPQAALPPPPSGGAPYGAPPYGPPPPQSKLPMVMGIGGLLLGALVAALALLRPAASGPTTMGTPMAMVNAACPGLEIYDPSLTKLSVPDLEERVLHTRIMMPSQAQQTLDTLKASVLNNAPDRRECMYRLSLLGTVASERTVLKTPAMWGMDKPVKELELAFLELPVKAGWSLDQKKAVLGKVESLFIASLKKNVPEDADYWRRMYYALELRCEVTDEALGKLGAKRPDSCLNLAP